MSNELTVHPVAAMFPMMSDDVLRELADDLIANGLIHPIVLDRSGALLDGRNRLAACELADVAPTFTTYTGSDPIGYAVSVNVKRRHLTDGQRAMLALEVLPLYEAETQRGRPPKGQETTADLQQFSKYERASNTRAAKAVGTSGRAVAQAKRVTEQAPDLAEQVTAGELPLDRAERIVRDRAAEESRKQRAREDAANRATVLRCEVRHGDFRDVLADLQDIDAVITDPPYGRNTLPLLRDLATWADKALTPEGVMAVLFGQLYLPEAMELLSVGRPYRWTMAYLTGGPGHNQYRARVQSHWKPVLIYGGGPRLDDVLRSDDTARTAKLHHKWGQDVDAFTDLIQRLCRPGMTVADPFAGAGTTLLAARDVGCHAIGAEVDADSHQSATTRLSL
jgi:hypothetical protein